MPIPFRRRRVQARRDFIGLPFHRTWPAVGASIPLMRLTRLLLPLPLGPRMATQSPAGIATSTDRSATIAPSSKARPTPSSATSGGGGGGASDGALRGIIRFLRAAIICA